MFHNCHTPRAFFATASEWFSCPLDQIQGAHVFRDHGESLTVVTLHGKALIVADGEGYTELRDTIRQLIPLTQPGFSTDHPSMGLVYLAGALLGVIAGFFLTPRAANDATLGLFVLCGAVLGTIVGYLVVWGGDRFLRTNLVLPIGFAVRGGGVGLVVSGSAGPWINWHIPSMIGLIVTGAVVGGAIGVRKQARERYRSEFPDANPETES